MKADLEGWVGFFAYYIVGIFQNGRLIKSLNRARLAMKSELKLKGDEEKLTILLTLTK